MSLKKCTNISVSNQALRGAPEVTCLQKIDAKVFMFYLAHIFMEMVGLFKAIWKLVKIWVFKPDFKVEIWETKKRLEVAN